MPGWLISLLIWGGLALAAINSVALLWGLATGAPPASDPGSAEAQDMPYIVYAVLIAVGAVAAAIGFDYRRRGRAPTGRV